jgi:hypothetical protein
LVFIGDTNLFYKILEKLGTGALAPSFCEAEAITSDKFYARVFKS